MRTFERARRPEEKELRRAAILKAAQELAQEVGPMALSLNELGRRSGVSKPNIYRYFEGREDVLLQLLVLEGQRLCRDLQEHLVPSGLTPVEVAQVFVEGFSARPLLCQLLGMVASILEHNLSVEAISAARRDIADLMTQAASAIRSAMPRLSDSQATWAFSTISLYVGGVWPAAHPAPVAAEVLTHPEFAGMKPDFGRDLGTFVEVLLLGLLARQHRSSLTTLQDNPIRVPKKTLGKGRSAP